LIVGSPKTYLVLLSSGRKVHCDFCIRVFKRPKSYKRISCPGNRMMTWSIATTASFRRAATPSPTRIRRRGIKGIIGRIIPTITARSFPAIRLRAATQRNRLDRALCGPRARGFPGIPICSNIPLFTAIRYKVKPLWDLAIPAVKFRGNLTYGYGNPATEILQSRLKINRNPLKIPRSNQL